MRLSGGFCRAHLPREDRCEGGVIDHTMVGSHFLFRARTQIKVETVRRLKDGSRLVRVPVRQKGRPRVIVERFYQRARTYVTPKRRLRSCPRKIRQPVSRWPRLLKNEYAEGPIAFNLL